MPLQGSFQGVYPILATPFDDRENVDLESFGRIVRFMADIGVDGVTILGVLGESGRMVDSEREQLIRTAVEAAGRIPVIVGTSHKGTIATRTLSRMAESLGAGAVMVTPSREPVPGEDRVFEYFRQTVQGISIPVVVQDHPASTEVHMSVELMLRIVRENRMGDAWDLYRRFLPLIVFEQQPGVAVRKEILRMRGLIASGRVRHPGAGLNPDAAVQLRALLDRTLPGVDLTRPLAL